MYNSAAQGVAVGDQTSDLLIQRQESYPLGHPAYCNVCKYILFNMTKKIDSGIENKNVMDLNGEIRA